MFFFAVPLLPAAASILLGLGVLDYATGPMALRAAAIAIVLPIGLLLIFRFGLLALAAETLVVETAQRCPLTLDRSSWYFGQSLLVLSLIAAIAIVAFWRSLGGKSILSGPVFEE